MKTKNRIFITVLTAALMITAMPKIAVNATSTAKCGYGQGKETDNKNCPLGASDFNSKYEKYGSYALTPEENRIILTFDQGYENGYTGQKEDELVKRMIDEGHILGNHGMTHASMPDLSLDKLKEEIMSLHEYVLEKYGYEMQYLRPPCGEYSEQSLALTNELGYKTLMWSFAYVDWKTDDQPDKASALEKIVSSGHSGGIFLLHSVSSTNAAVLGDAIDELRKNGFNL